LSTPGTGVIVSDPLATELGWRVEMAPVFGRAMYYDNGEYGEALLSKIKKINSSTKLLVNF